MMTVVVAKVLATFLAMATLANATSFKMDFLSAGTVRTDPLVYSQVGLFGLGPYFKYDRNFLAFFTPSPH